MQLFSCSIVLIEICSIFAAGFYNNIMVHYFYQKNALNYKRVFGEHRHNCTSSINNNVLTSVAMMICLLFLFSFSVSAKGGFGILSDDPEWDIENGTLTISGNGPMPDYGGGTVTNAPWGERRSEFTNVVIEEGISSIGNNAFRGCSNITSISIPNSVTSIGVSAFEGCTQLGNITIPFAVN